jgi:4-hydroxybenzoate polyprenyltransferase
MAGAAALLAYQRKLIHNREPARCFQAFLNNHYLGATIFTGIMLDYTFR